MTYLEKLGQAPTGRQLRQLVDRDIRDGMAWHLDQDDEIVRRTDRAEVRVFADGSCTAALDDYRI
jgi:hypothetical protein